MHFVDVADMEAHRELGRLAAALDAIATTVTPTAVWSPAYEGVHPDHDVAAYLAARLVAGRGLPHFEFALYRFEHGLTRFTFAGDDPGWERRLTGEDAAFQRRLRDVYVSQRPIVRALQSDVERYRRAAAYDFNRPPASGAGYDGWGWPVTSAMLIDAFRRHDEPPTKS